MFRIVKIFSTLMTQALIRRLLRRRRPSSRCKGLRFPSVGSSAVVLVLVGCVLGAGQSPPSLTYRHGVIAYLDLLGQGSAMVTWGNTPHGFPEEDLKVADGPMLGEGRAKVLFDEAICCGLRYMVPMNTDATLLLTVWDRGTPRVLYINHGSVRMVLGKTPMSGWPEAVGNNGTLLLHQGRRMVGNLIIPTQTELWQWNQGKEEFELKATVPYEHRYRDLAKFLDSE